MKDSDTIISRVTAAVAHALHVNLQHLPLRLELEDGVLAMDGEVEHIMAKKRALEAAAAVPGVTGIIDRLHVAPAEQMEDGEIRDHVCNALLAENLLASCAVRAVVRGKPETVRDPAGATGSIDVEVLAGVVVLNGTVPSLSAKRLAGVLAWWVPGSRDVINGVEVAPPEEDSDDEVVDAVRLVLEKDPFVNQSQITVSCRNYDVTLKGLVRTATEGEMAEADCWYVFRVNRVKNLLMVGT